MAEVALMKYCRVCVTEAGGGWSGADEVLSCGCVTEAGGG